jgi:hypothetical protein
MPHHSPSHGSGEWQAVPRQNDSPQTSDLCSRKGGGWGHLNKGREVGHHALCHHQLPCELKVDDKEECTDLPGVPLQRVAGGPPHGLDARYALYWWHPAPLTGWG